MNNEIASFRDYLTGSRTFVDSPQPGFVKKHSYSNVLRPSQASLNLLNAFHNIKTQHRQLSRQISEIENLMRNRQCGSEMSVSGINLLSDSIEI